MDSSVLFAMLAMSAITAASHLFDKWTAWSKGVRHVDLRCSRCLEFQLDREPTPDVSTANAPPAPSAPPAPAAPAAAAPPA